MRGGSTRGCRLDRSGPGCGLAILLLAAGAGEVRAAAEVTSEPATLVAGQVSTARLTIRGAGLGGALGAAVSEGQVRAVTGVGSDVVVDYALAAGAHPRRLCLLVWGDPGSGGPAPQVVVLRVPVHGRTTIPVRTRRNSSVEVRVADRTFGPVSTGQRGRASVEVLVPPGVSQAAVEVTDQDGLRSSRSVRIRRAAYEQIAVAAVPVQVTDEQVRVRVVAAAVDDEVASVEATVAGEQLRMRPAGDRWEAIWAPADRPGPGEQLVEVLARHGPGGRSRTAKQVVVRVLPVVAAAPATTSGGLDVVRGPAPSSSGTGPASAESRLQPTIGVGVGVWGNLGHIVAPRLGAEARLDYDLGPGIVGLGAGVALTWASQTIAAPDPLPGAESSLLLVPVTVAAVYRHPLRIVSPYLMPAFVAQIVRTRNAGEGIAERVRYDAVFGFSLVAGVDRRLGPGRVFVQGGYLFGRLDRDEVTLSTGGLLLDAGYRFLL